MKAAVTHNRQEILSKVTAILTVVMLLLTACGQAATGTEDELVKWLAESQTAVEAKDSDALVDMISSGYSDVRGYERDDIGNLLHVYFLRPNTIGLLTAIDEIRVFGETAAEIELTVGMAGTTDEVFGFSADAYRFELELEQDGDDWLLISARWGELGTELH